MYQRPVSSYEHFVRWHCPDILEIVPEPELVVTDRVDNEVAALARTHCLAGRGINHLEKYNVC
jgi:hypothetical protein